MPVRKKSGNLSYALRTYIISRCDLFYIKKKLAATKFIFLFTVVVVINFVYFILVTWFQVFEF